MADPARTLKGPLRFVEKKPQKHAIVLNGRAINIRKIGAVYNLNVSYLSKIMNGKVSPSVRYLKIVADALVMDLADLLTAIERRNRTPSPAAAKLESTRAAVI
jgi:transcriptional regulator with XRE-family HTH domain